MMTKQEFLDRLKDIINHAEGTGMTAMDVISEVEDLIEKYDAEVKE